jgi:hypothetical protein
MIKIENLRRLMMSTLLICVCAFVHAQKVEVSGTITDTNGESVIGATVQESGTDNRTITDLEGQFSLSVKSGATLTISYIGYKTVSLPARTSMKVTLEEDNSTLQEIVVTATPPSARPTSPVRCQW